ncbi:hypothetical protein SAMN05443247_11539 [Bradyrhizobium erythrophlei]|nr:hypothetical protein SAMN05443247_11539 [Bradyrhizobium erythrophlei]
MRILGTAALCAALGGCAAAPKMLWLRADGQHIRDNPVYAQQFEMDGTVCLGERSKANLSGVTFTGGGLSGVAAAQNRAAAADSVQRGCMAEKGYLLVPEEQGEAKLAELAAIAEQKRKQEAAAAVPAAVSAKPRKPMAKPAAAAAPAT